MMQAGFSSYLHMLRFGAALVVVLSHFAYPRFSEGRWIWMRELNLGSDAVVVFFVLSGFLIAMSAQEKDKSLLQYIASRATRLLSVALPALVLGFLLDRWGGWMDPALYAPPYVHDIAFWEQMLRGATFSNEWTAFPLDPVRLGSNGPYWSLSYEAAYYLMFGFAVYLTGLRRAGLIAIMALVAGLNVLLLMPSWLLGVALYHRVQRADRPGMFVAWLLALLPVVGYCAALMGDMPSTLSALQPPLGNMRFSDEYLWNALLGLGVTLHLFGVMTLARDTGMLARARTGAAWLSGAGFSLYLVHYPLLQFLQAALPPMRPTLHDLTLFGLTIVLCFAFASAFERPLKFWRGLLGRVWHRRTVAPSDGQVT